MTGQIGRNDSIALLVQNHTEYLFVTIHLLIKSELEKVVISFSHIESNRGDLVVIALSGVHV